MLSSWLGIAFCRRAPIETESIHQFLPDGRLAREDEEEQQTPQHVEGAGDPEENRLEGVIVAGAVPFSCKLVQAFKDPRKAKNHEHLSKKDLCQYNLLKWCTNCSDVLPAASLSPLIMESLP